MVIDPRSRPAQKSDARYWIEKLHLQQHPEGGHYCLTYTAATQITQTALPAGFAGGRPASTAIYFLLSNQGTDTAEHFSAFHRLRSDEMWHFYTGHALAVHVLHPDGAYEELRIGSDADQGENFQAFVKAGCWFASAPLSPNTFALVGCTVSPGFDFADFELAQRARLSKEFPQHADLIARFTRE